MTVSLHGHVKRVHSHTYWARTMRSQLCRIGREGVHSRITNFFSWCPRLLPHHCPFQDRTCWENHSSAGSSVVVVVVCLFVLCFVAVLLHYQYIFYACAVRACWLGLYHFRITQETFQKRHVHDACGKGRGESRGNIWKLCKVHLKFIIIIIYPLTARVVGAPQMTSQPVFSIFLLFSTALWDLPDSRPFHWSLMLSSHFFLCLPCLLPPFTVPCKMVLARPDERETWSYHCSLRLFTMVRRSSCGPIVGNMVFVWDVQYLAVAPFFHGLYSSFELYCEGPRFTSVQEDGCDKRAHQVYLGAGRNTPVIPNWFQPCRCCCCLCYPGECLRLRTLISYNWTLVLEACDCFKLLSIHFDLCVDATGVYNFRCRKDICNWEKKRKKITRLENFPKLKNGIPNTKLLTKTEDK